MSRNASVWTVAVVLALGLAATGCGDDDDGNGGGTEGANGAAETAPAEVAQGLELTLDPESGPPGTTVSWTVSDCEPADRKSVAIYSGTIEDYQEGALPGEAASEEVFRGPEGTDPSGTITVPDELAAGDYVVTATCSSREDLGGGQIRLGVREGFTEFTVTG